MAMKAEEIERRILAMLPDANVSLKDLAGDDDHWEITVTSASFKGLSRVQQHQLVYRAIGEDMGNALHALSVKTRAS